MYRKDLIQEEILLKRTILIYIFKKKKKLDIKLEKLELTKKRVKLFL